jgi:hypothetical protein
MLSEKTRAEIKDAFRAGNLKVKAVDPQTGIVSSHSVSDVLRHCTPNKRQVLVTLIDGRSIQTTVDHSLFTMVEGLPVPIQAEKLTAGSLVVSLGKDGLEGSFVAQVDPVEPEFFTYDLSVPGVENFFTTNGILAHNSYSIGGISLDIDRSSKYMDLKRNAEEQWDKMVEAKARTTKFMRGLQQPRFGRGIRSAFGPNVGRGVLSPRNFVVFAFCAFGAHYLLPWLHLLNTMV